MAGAVIVILLILAVSTLIHGIRRSRTIVARRGVSIGADLGTLSDRPRVLVHEVTATGPDRVHLVLALVPGSDGKAPAELDFMVSLREAEFGFQLLREWQQSASVIAVVLPPGSRLVRLRSVDSLQPLTLSRVDR